MERPPVAEQRPHVHVEHGVERPDPWSWIRDRSDPAVLELLGQENAWVEQRLAHLAELRKALYDEMLAREKEDDESVPAPLDGHVYWRRTEKGKSYRIDLRRPKEGGPEQVMLDANVVGEGKDYVSVVPLGVSPDRNLLAYATDFAGDERYTLRFRDLRTGEDLPDAIPDTAAQVVWAADSRSVWWTEQDASLRPFRVRLHVLGSGDGSGDPEVWTEGDDEQRVGITESQCGTKMYVVSFNHGCVQYFQCDASTPMGPVRPLTPRAPHLRHKVAYAGGRWFVATDADGDANYRLCELTADGDPDPSTWKVVIPHRADTEISSLLGLDRWLIVVERERGQIHVRVMSLVDGSDRRMPLPETPCVLELGDNLESDTDLLRLKYVSMTTPVTTLELDLRTLETRALKQLEVPTYDPHRYVTRRVEVPTADGVTVPISIVHHVDVDPSKGACPLLLYGYGSYGLTVDPTFVSPRVSLLDRGVVFAIAHIRGGGFLGRSWYLDGKLANKQHTFDDFVACLDHLHALGWSNPDKTVVMGGSAGGLLMGAVLNQAPDRMKAAVAMVPFVDVVSTMLDESIPLTTGEWKEWGDPRTPEDFRTMLAYSPYDNVKAQVYPDVLVVAGLNDPRVAYWEPAKWVQKLRATATGGEVLLKMHMGAGHQGRSGRYGYLEDRAFEFAWVLEQLGLT